ncbi:MAG TPA: biopolymer transporter ExbD [Polyangiaceae bacterium]|jgi:biopolymer transport protein ExbD
MPVANPGRRLMRSVGLEFVQKKVAGGGHRSTNAALSLTSMIDFLIVTVIFLLMSFSASGETPVAKGLNLPKAENTLDMLDAPIVAVVGSQILVDGSPAGNTRAVEESDRMQRIDELFNILKAKRELWKQTHPQKDFPGVAMLQIDASIKAVVVKSVFQTAAFAGFPNVSFMVDKLPASGSQ